MKRGRKVIVIVAAVLVVLVVLGGLSYKGFSILKERADREGCILNIQHIQQAMRAYHGIHKMNVGDPLEAEAVFDRFFKHTPRCNAGGTYTYINRVPKEGELFCTCSHAETKGHVPEDYEGW